MAVIALASASGAPGVTTSALALAFAWPRPILIIEADPSGGTILPGYLRGEVEASRSIAGVPVAHRYGRLAEEMPNNTFRLDDKGDVTFLPGFTDPAQAAHMQPVWSAMADLASSMERLGIDVLVDAGRLGATYSPTPMLDIADALLLVSRTSLTAAAGLRPRAASLHEQRVAAGRTDTIGLLLVGEGRPYAAKDISETIAVPTWASMAWDPGSAAIYSDGAARGRGFARSSLVRSAQASAEQVIQHINDRRQRLAPASRSAR